MTLAILFETIAVAIVAMLALSALSKLVPSTALHGTIESLEISNSPLLRFAPAGLGLYEIASAVAFVGWRHPAAGFNLWLLGSLFAGVAIFALVRDLRVDCNCFGAGDSELGWRQVGALPLWLLAGLVPVLSSRFQDQPIENRAAVGLTGLVIVSLVVLRRLAPLWSRASSDRLASSRLAARPAAQ